MRTYVQYQEKKEREAEQGGFDFSLRLRESVGQHPCSLRGQGILIPF